jgi:phi LC3 family holin
MKNLKKRLKNPVFVTAIISGTLLVLKGFGVINFNEDIDKLTSIIITIGITLGIWTDPTTPGLADK